MNISQGRSRRTLGLTAAVCAVVVVIAAGIAIAVDHQHHGAGYSSDPSVSPPRPADTGDGFAAPVTDVFGRRVDIPVVAAGHPLPQTPEPIAQTDPSWLTAPPIGVRERGGWQRVHGVSVPFSTSDGPTRITESMAAGYSRTPRGAALAAVYIAHQLAARPADPAVVARVAYEPGDLANWHARVAAGQLPKQQPEAVTRWIVAPDAYEITSWSPDLCGLNVAMRANPGSSDEAPTWTVVPYTVTWAAGDWNLVPDRKVGGGNQIVSILGWTPW